MSNGSIDLEFLYEFLEDKPWLSLRGKIISKQVGNKCINIEDDIKQRSYEIDVLP